MATLLCFSLALHSDPQHHRHHQKPPPFSLFLAAQKHPFFHTHNPPRFTFKPSSSHPSPPTTTTTSSPSTTYSLLEDTFKTGKFLTNEEVNSLKTLQDFNFSEKLATGSMWVRVMRQEEMDITVRLLAESFAESMLIPVGYVSLLRFLVKQYLIERREVLPHAVTLIAFYRDDSRTKEDGEEGEVELAGTVEVCFDRKGANSSPPSPTPPKDSPYICNMTVKEPLRRRGIGWNLLKASEELVSQMSHGGEVYLHCRMIDSAPFNMYIKAGYTIVKTDSILVLLMLQRRKHLMCKKLPAYESSKPGISGSEMELSLQQDAEKL